MDWKQEAEIVTQGGKVRGPKPGIPSLRSRRGCPGAILDSATEREGRHLCVASANCARWKSAANRLISSQASAITALLAKPPKNCRHVSLKAAGAEAERAARRDKRLLPRRRYRTLAPREGRAGRAAAPPTSHGRGVFPVVEPQGFAGSQVTRFLL